MPRRRDEARVDDEYPYVYTSKTKNERPERLPFPVHLHRRPPPSLSYCIPIGSCGTLLFVSHRRSMGDASDVRRGTPAVVIPWR